MDLGKQDKVLIIRKQLKNYFPNSKIALSYSNPWELFVSVVLSAQTTDKKVNEVTPSLFADYNSPEEFAKLDPIELEEQIKSIGLYRTKAKNIINAAKIITVVHKGKIPTSMEQLLELPGVGRKTANVLLDNLYKTHEGIAVDTHVRRLAYLFSLSSSKNPEKIERDLMRIVPKEYWGEITYLLIDYGRKYCTASCKHSNCPLREFIVVQKA